METVPVARVRVLVGLAAVEPNACRLLNSLKLGPQRPFVVVPRKNERVEASEFAKVLNHYRVEWNELIPAAFVVRVTRDGRRSLEVDVFPPQSQRLADPPSSHVVEH